MKLFINRAIGTVKVDPRVPVATVRARRARIVDPPTFAGSHNTLVLGLLKFTNASIHDVLRSTGFSTMLGTSITNIWLALTGKLCYQGPGQRS